MNKLNRWVKAVLATSMTAALSIANSASAFELRSDLNLTTGYRNDRATFAICSQLSNPDFFGYGEAKLRNIHMWEVAMNAVGAFTDNVYFRGRVDYATALGGNYKDSGIFDILSNPFNATLGQHYSICCKGCECNDICPCDCTCGESTYRNTVPSGGAIGGNAWDADIALGYMFHASEEFGIAPVIGWSYNYQRWKTKHSSYGPIPLQYSAMMCDNCNWATQEILYSGAPAGVGLRIDVDDSCDGESVSVEVSTDGQAIGCEAPCVLFGDCGDTTFRSRWNGPFIGLDFLWTPSMDWTVTFGYELHYEFYNGRIATLGGSPDCCANRCSCDHCPKFTSMVQDASIDSYQACVDLCPSTGSISSNGWGQKFYATLNYQVNQNWQVGLLVDYNMANANKCDSIGCEACCEVYNGAALRDPTDAIEDFGTYPVWQNANFQKARWRSFTAQVSVGYLF